MLRLLTFGTLALQNGRSITEGVGAQRSRLALLAALATAGDQGMSREKLLGLFWPEIEEDRGRHALKQATYSIRQFMGADAISAGSSNVTLNTALISTDVADFVEACSNARFEEAVRIYGGSFLDGVYLRNAEAFEQWVDAERRKYSDMFGHVLTALADQAERSKRFDQALPWRKRLVDHDRFSSRAVVELMRLLATSGDIPQALYEARKYEALVKSELGAPPDPAVLNLVATLKRSAASSVARTEEAVAPLSPASVSTPPAASNVAVRSRASWKPRLPHVAASIAAIVIVSAAISASGPDLRMTPHKVSILSFENRTGDTALGSLGAVASKLVDDEVARSLPASPRKTADLAISGAYYRRNDVIELLVQITGRRGEDAIRIPLDPISGPISEQDGILEAVRERVPGALATLLDERLGLVIDGTASLPTLKAYRMYADGYDAFLGNHGHKALEDFERAYSADTTFVSALMLGALTAGYIGRYSKVIEFVELMETRRGRLSPQDRYGLDYLVARGQGNNQDALAAIRRASKLAPGSYWSGEHAEFAIELNRPSEALSVYARFDSAAPTLRLWARHAYSRPRAFHMLANHTAEYAAARELADSTRLGHRLVAMAASGLGDTAAVYVAVKAMLAQPGQVRWTITDLNIIGNELASHGYPARGRTVHEEAIRAYAAMTDTGAYGESGRLAYAQSLEAIGRLDDAAAEYRALAAIRVPAVLESRPMFTYRIVLSARAYLGALEARRGNRAAALTELLALRQMKERFPIRDAAGPRWVFGEHDVLMAMVESALNRRAEALTSVKRGFGMGHSHPYWLGHWNRFPELTQFEPFMRFNEPALQ